MTKKDIIIEHAIELFQKNGIDKTTVSQIVQAGNMAQGTFYLYFPSKMSLMPAIAEEMVKIMMNEIKMNVSMDDPISEQIESIVDSIFSVNKQYSELLAMIYTGLSQTEHLKEWETVYEPCYEWIMQVIKRGQKAGVIQSKLPADQSAKLLIGLVESGAEQVFLYAHTNEREINNQKQAVKKFLFNALLIK
ncbi:MAG TPA: TetR family transcriptional regulator [Bacillota bacterium]|nr:TetR family transcriptional regulator [Bacillota bacterium]